MAAATLTFLGGAGTVTGSKSERCASEGAAPALVLCDRGTIDGGAYWPGPGALWTEVGTSRELELQRYAAVIHLRTPSEANGYDWSNPRRTESAREAAVIDERIAQSWEGHPDGSS